MIRYKLQLEATNFTKQQLQQQLDILEQNNILQIALAGRSNVGKSSLINALAGRKQLAKTSGTPGKTRSINFYAVYPNIFMLVDLPGYGYAQCSKIERQYWAKLIEYYLKNCSNLKAFVLLIDCRIPPQKLDYELAEFATSYCIPLIPVLTKIDKCKLVEQNKRQKEWRALLNNTQPLLVSSKNMKGVQQLWERIQYMIDSCLNMRENELS